MEAGGPYLRTLKNGRYTAVEIEMEGHELPEGADKMNLEQAAAVRVHGH